jgi:hypothetical protein
VSIYDVIVNGINHKVEIKNKSEDIKLQRQKEIVATIKSFFNQHPAILITLISAYISVSGFITLWIVFIREDINLFDYASPSDFFFGVFAVSTGPLVILAVFILLGIGYISYLKKAWTTPASFWWVVTLYLMIAPVVAPLLIYKPYTLCSTSFDSYEITYKIPNTTKESGFFLIASLSNYKVFKKEYPGCNVKYEDYDKYPEPEGTEVIAINDSAIAKIKRIPKI